MDDSNSSRPAFIVEIVESELVYIKLVLYASIEALIIFVKNLIFPVIVESYCIRLVLYELIFVLTLEVKKIIFM